MSNDYSEKNSSDDFNTLNEDELRKVSFDKYIKSPPDIYKFTKHLISLINEITPEDELLLFLFLQTTFHYERILEKKKNCSFLSLSLMAELLESEQDDDECYKEPLFDLILRAIIKNTIPRVHNDLKNYYALFNEVRNNNSQFTLIYYICKIIINYKPPEEQ